MDKRKYSKPSIIQLQLIQMLGNLDQSMENEKFCSQLSTYYKSHVGVISKRTFRLLRAAGEIETTQENIQDWLELDVGDPGFQFLTKKEIAAAIFLFIYFHQHYLHY
jgi:Ca2+-binding EF-hand superfamily protein